MHKFRNRLFSFIFFLICAGLLVFVIRGKAGNPIYYQTQKDTDVGGPFESSNSTSRYALVEAIAEHHTFFFTDAEAKFSSPDLVKYQDHYFSIFTPGVSMFAVPFYLVGKMVNLPQLFTYLSTILFALLNIYLIHKLAEKLHAPLILSWLSGLIFLFGTNALVYATLLTQHEASTTVILAALLTAMGKRSLLKNLLLGILFGAGVLLDIPNAFILMPIVLYVIAQHFNLKQTVKDMTLTINFRAVALGLGLIPVAALFIWYNVSLTGSYTKLGQFIGQYNYPSDQTINQPIPQVDTNITIDPTPAPSSKISLPFKTRLQLQDFYILFLSQQRAWWFYSPIVLVGILGLILAYFQSDPEIKSFSLLATAVIMVNVLLYSMFADPWGGWAFGPRYLIPAAAILAIFIPQVIMKYGKNILVMLAIFALGFYSFAISSLGALTTAAIPPKGEAESLSSPIPYTWKYNWEILNDKQQTSSLVYNLTLKNQITPVNYAVGFAASVSVIFVLLYLKFIIGARIKNHK